VIYISYQDFAGGEGDIAPRAQLNQNKKMGKTDIAARMPAICLLVCTNALNFISRHVCGAMALQLQYATDFSKRFFASTRFLTHFNPFGRAPRLLTLWPGELGQKFALSSIS
jgi:hypothetical protein